MKILSTSTGVNAKEEEQINENKYVIRKDGQDIESVTMQEFVERVQSGDITYEFGKQIVIPYVDAITNNTYELPFNFATRQNFTKENGSTFSGLGLIAEYSVPTDITYYYNVQFDGPETSSSNADRKKWGNNRWKYSNLRQWLNKAGKNWYTAQHSSDSAPNAGVMSSHSGFLSCLPEDFVEACVIVKNTTKLSTTDGSGTDTTYDKFFTLSMSQANMKCTNTKYGLNTETEGRYWDIWRQKQGGTAYWSGTFSSGDFTNNAKRIIYRVDNHTSARSWWTRSVVLDDACGLWIVTTSGNISSSDAKSQYGVMPACVIG